jgi:hypothetical protein
MILPEHKEAYNQHRQQLRKKPRPQLDDQEAERISAALVWSLQTRKPVRLKMYDLYEDPIVEGIVERVDRQMGRIRVDGEWFPISEIIGVEC